MAPAEHVAAHQRGQYHPGVLTIDCWWVAFRGPSGPLSSRSGGVRGALAAALIMTLMAFTGALAGAGVLGAGDEKLSSGEYFDRVSFTGAAGDEVLVELSSTDFDPYLIIIDANDNVLAQEDDSPGMGLGVRLSFRLPTAGEFTLVVTSALVGETGGYRLVLSAPGQAGQGQPPTSNQQARSVIGTAVDTQGRPIAGARVWVLPALTTGVAEVRTDAEGRYRVEGLIDVPYRARAWAYVDYGGQQVCMRLGMDSPADYDTFLPTSGAVRNFRMQLTGPIEDLRDLNEHFGGMIRVMSSRAFEGNQLEFTFTPTGPLVDGTRSEPFVRTLNPARDSDIKGIPVGPYRVSAAVVSPDGSRRPLPLALDSFDEMQAAVDVDWTSDGSCSNTSGFDWVYIYPEFPE